IVGPFDSQTAVDMLPIVEQDGIATISPTATLPGLTQSDQAAAEGLTFTQLHPKGKPNVFFRLPQTDSAAGTVAADLAIAAPSAHGLGAHSIFIVDDGTASGKALATAFKQELAAKHGAVAGQQSLVTGAQDNAQAIVSAIVEAAPDAVFFAGGIAGGADLRATLTLTGVPQLPILTAGPIANDPSWSGAVGVVPAAAYTTAILPAPDLSTLPSAKSFMTAYQSAYPNQDLLPQSALAYDAAMVEITAIKALLTAGKPVTRAAVLAAVASAKYAGLTGAIAFNANGDNTTPLSYSLYTCDIKGAWHYVIHL
ncbi:MAG: branched-chain amino acid ABC transporter substrate-binding protein, partial [Ktedonobacterales bacterium]